MGNSVKKIAPSGSPEQSMNTGLRRQSSEISTSKKKGRGSSKSGAGKTIIAFKFQDDVVPSPGLPCPEGEIQAFEQLWDPPVIGDKWQSLDESPSKHQARNCYTEGNGRRDVGKPPIVSQRSSRRGIPSSRSTRPPIPASQQPANVNNSEEEMEDPNCRFEGIGRARSTNSFHNESRRISREGVGSLPRSRSRDEWGLQGNPQTLSAELRKGGSLRLREPLPLHIPSNHGSRVDSNGSSSNHSFCVESPRHERRLVSSRRRQSSSRGPGSRSEGRPSGKELGPLLPYPVEDIRVRMKPLGKELGRGNFGVVTVWQVLETGEKVACKSISRTRLRHQKDLEDIRREMEVMKRLKGHPHICELRGVHEDDEEMHLVMELCPGKALSYQILQRKRLTEPEVVHIFSQIVRGVSWMHANGVMHRDLKPENILLSAPTDPNYPTRVRVKLADFGLAVFLKPGEYATGLAGSPYYFAPEVVAGGEYGREADIWSLGVVLYVLLSGMLPFFGENDKDIFARIRVGKVVFSHKYWKNVSSEAQALVLALLSLDPKKRPTAEEIVEDVWFSSTFTV